MPIGADQWIADNAISTCGGDAAQQLAAIKLATAVVESLAGGQYGIRPAMVRPLVYAAGCGCWTPREHGCIDATKLTLPGYVASVTEVKVDGVVIDPAAYALFDAAHLVRIDGDTWPLGQSLATPDGDVGTMSVAYVEGVPPGAAGEEAVRALACELVKAATGQACAFPPGTTSVVREGVSLQIIDPQALVTGGGTGVTATDRWLGVVNPEQLRSAPRIVNPDDLHAAWPA